MPQAFLIRRDIIRVLFEKSSFWPFYFNQLWFLRKKKLSGKNVSIFRKKKRKKKDLFQSCSYQVGAQGERTTRVKNHQSSSVSEWIASWANELISGCALELLNPRILKSDTRIHCCMRQGLSVSLTLTFHLYRTTQCCFYCTKEGTLNFEYLIGS